MSTPGTLIFLCGKMAAGKSTLARELAALNNAVLLVQDDLLAVLFPGEITDVSQFVARSSRLQDALAPMICDTLSRGTSVVLDFPGNTPRQRAWFRTILNSTGAPHELHFIDATDELCREQLRIRSADLPAGIAWTSESDFDTITAYFQPPAPDEGFNVVRHTRA